ncbi:hypothetical protein DFQ28_002411 [Apophysomyces sp. BC1034]|nr:hypothetical protein DFQ28_002411 [Apophysomyces sp. BC1034]
MSDKDTQPTNVIISPAWIRGIHIDGTQAKKQAVEIDGSANMYLFPNSVLEVSNLSHIPERRGQIGTGSIGTYEPFKLPLPGTPEFKIAAKAAVAGDTTETSKGSQQYEIRIPRKYIILPPAALRATKEFEEAIHSALQLTTDDEKFIGLQHVFEEFGYYYPYWITTGGRFLLKTSGPVSGTTKEIIEEAFKQELEWEASGGDLNLLYDGPDVHGWLESTATRQDLVLPLDVNAIYDLLEHEVNSEVQRIYKMKYYQPSPQDSLLIEMGNTMTNSLVRLSQTREKVGVAKGVHVSGLLSEEDVVELVNETDVTELMRPVSVAGKPRVECMVRCTIFGTNIVTHAFLPDDFLYGSAEDSGFGRAAMTHHVESNAGKIQPSTYKVRYLVMYVTYNEGTDKFKQAVTKALDMKSDMEKYQELQKVFKRFGYYYPSSISLVAINDAMMMDDSNNGIETIGMDEDGGHSTVTGCQNWIGSIQANQTRIQFRSLRPIYELLEDEQGAQIQRLYDENQNYVDSFPEIPKGLHFDGIEAEHQAIELTRDGTSSKMIMLRNFSNLPNLEHVKLYMKDSKEIENYLSLDIDTNRKLPGDAGFVAGSKGAYKERSHACESYHSKTKAIYDIAYVTYKELHLYDELIQPTKQFQQAVDKALLVGRDDQDTYYALQDVFQRFGYYYPTSVYIGGRIVLKVFLQNQVNQLSIRLKDSQNVLEKASEIGAEKSPTIVAIAQSKKNNHNNTKSKSDGAIIKVNQTISKAVVTGAIEKSLTKSERWNSIGGDSVLLLLNDVKGWMNTVKRSQTITKRRGIKPIYELLSEEQRHKVQQTYENVFLEDDRVRYDCMLELTPYDEVFGKEQESASEGLPISVLVLMTQGYTF